MTNAQSNIETRYRTSFWPGMMVTEHRQHLAINDVWSKGWIVVKREHDWIGVRTWWNWRRTVR